MMCMLELPATHSYVPLWFNLFANVMLLEKCITMLLLLSGHDSLLDSGSGVYSLISSCCPSSSNVNLHSMLTGQLTLSPVHSTRTSPPSRSIVFLMSRTFGGPKNSRQAEAKFY